MIWAAKTALLSLTLLYVLPTYSILRRMAAGRDEQALTQLKVEGSAVVSPSSARQIADLLGVEWISGELQLNFTVALRFPGRCRIELSSAQSTKSLVAVSSNGKRRSEGGALPALQAAADEVCALIALHGAGEGESRAAVERHLGALKVNQAATSLGRFRGTVAYVIGDPTETAAQLWVSKDHFTPARIRFSDEQQVRWDVQFFDFTSQAAGDWFPRVLLVQRDGESVLRMTALKGDARGKLEDALF